MLKNKKAELDITYPERGYLDDNGYLHLVSNKGDDTNLGCIKGLDGKDGKDGKDGLDGKDGKDGKDGLDGKDGANGKDGLDGKDGKDGIDGKDGLDGKDGIDGKDGLDGKKGQKGEPGEKGEQGEKGDKGDKGEQGEQGPVGESGGSKNFKIIDVNVTTNQENPNKEIAVILVENLSVIEFDILGYGASGLNWFASEKAAVFVVTDRVEKVQEDIIKKPVRTSNPALKVVLNPVTSGVSIVVHGSPDEEMIWKGKITIGAI